MHKNANMYKICKNVRNIYGKGKFLQKCDQYEQVGKTRFGQQKLNQQDFLEGDGAGEKHKREIHLEGATQVLLFLNNIKIIKNDKKP